MKDFKKILNEMMKDSEEFNDFKYSSKYEFLGNNVFNFVTYDGEFDIILARSMIEVIEVIIEDKNFEYIKNRDNYLNYIIMINMPFLYNMLDWGTSIRGAWIDGSKEIQIDCYNLTLEIQKGEILDFLRQMIEWVNE